MVLTYIKAISPRAEVSSIQRSLWLTLQMKGLQTGDKIKVFNILNGYENIKINMSFSLKKDSRTR